MFATLLSFSCIRLDLCCIQALSCLDSNGEDQLQKGTKGGEKRGLRWGECKPALKVSMQHCRYEHT